MSKAKKSKVQEILLGEGLSDLPFGATREEVEEVFGEPEEKDVVDLGDEESISWHYWKLGISLNFDESENYALCTIEVASPEVTLFGKKMIGMTREAAVAFLDTKGIGVSRPETKRGVMYDDVSLTLWFNGDEVTEIQWGEVGSLE